MSLPAANQGPGPSVLPSITLPELQPEIVISAGGHRRGLGQRRGLGRGRGKGWTVEDNNTISNIPSIENVTQSTQSPRSRGRFIPVRTFIFRPASPQTRAGPRERRPRGTTFIRRNILPNVNLVITSSGKK